MNIPWESVLALINTEINMQESVRLKLIQNFVNYSTDQRLCSMYRANKDWDEENWISQKNLLPFLILLSISGSMFITSNIAKQLPVVTMATALITNIPDYTAGQHSSERAFTAKIIDLWFTERGSHVYRQVWACLLQQNDLINMQSEIRIQE